MAKWHGFRPKYTNAEDIKEVADKYFRECDKEGKYPTVTGLGYMLGLSREAMCDYQKCIEADRLRSLDYDVRVAIADTIKECKRYIESRSEDKLFENGNPVGAIFSLKNNYKWVDKTEQVIENKTIDIDLKD